MSVYRPAVVVAALAIALSSRAASAGECEASSGELLAATNTATAAFSGMDEHAFLTARIEARKALVCLNEPLAAAEVAAYHRMEALAAFFEDRRDAAMLSFGAALSVQPEYELPASIAPRGTPLHDWYEDARGRPHESKQELQVPERCSLLINGALETRHAEDLPAIVQVIEWNGAVRWSGLLEPHDILPEEAFSDVYTPFWDPDTELAARVAALPPPLVDDSTGVTVTPLMVGAGATLVASGSLYLASMLSRSSWQQAADRCALEGACWDDPVSEQENIDALRRRTNGLSLAAAGAGAVGVGLGVVVLVQLDW
jgi:hypothetical protein